jgi:hypothetical protein
MKFSNLTVVGITGHDDYTQGTYRSIVHSTRLLEGSTGILFSPSPPQGLGGKVRHVAIAPFDYAGYSQFCLYCLGDFIDTSHCLVVQHDGWVLDAAKWDDAYWQYDYIGAPTPVALVETPKGLRFTSGYDWEIRGPENVKGLILNGGFSLRSKRLLDIPRQFALNQVVNPPDLTGSPLTMRWRGLYYGNEDIQICAFWRQALINHGIRYAPLDVAQRFSYEHAGDHSHDGFDFSCVFGHHSKYRMMEEGDRPSIIYQMRESELGENLKSVEAEQAFIASLRARGYRVRFRDA